MASPNYFAECESPRMVHVELKKLLCCEYLHEVKCSENFEKFKLNCEKHFTTPAKKQLSNPGEIIEKLRSDGVIGIGDYGKLKSLVRDIDVDIEKLIKDAEEIIKSFGRQTDDPRRKRKRKESQSYLEEVAKGDRDQQVREQTLVLPNPNYKTEEDQVTDVTLLPKTNNDQQKLRSKIDLLMRIDFADIVPVNNAEYEQTVRRMILINDSLSEIALEVGSDPSLLERLLEKDEEFITLVSESAKILRLIYHIDDEVKASKRSTGLLKLAEKGKEEFTKDDLFKKCQENWRKYNKVLKKHIYLHLWLTEKGATWRKRYFGSIIMLLRFECKQNHKKFLESCNNGVIRDELQDILITADFLKCFKLKSAKIELSVDQEECFSLLDERANEEIKDLISRNGQDKENNKRESYQEDDVSISETKLDGMEKRENDSYVDRQHTVFQELTEKGPTAIQQISDKSQTVLTKPDERSIDMAKDLSDEINTLHVQISRVTCYLQDDQKANEKDVFHRRASSESYIVPQKRRNIFHDLPLRRTQSEPSLLEKRDKSENVSRQTMQERELFQKEEIEDTGTIQQQLLKEMDPLRYQRQDNKHATKDESNVVRLQTTYESNDVPKFNQEKRDREHASLMENLKKKETKKILIIGEQGVGKSSFVNSAAMAITGRYASLATAGLKGDNVSNVTIDLTRYAPEDYCPESPKSMNADARKNLPVFIDVMGFDDNLSNRLVEANMDPKSEGTDPAMSKFGDHVKSVNSILMEYILRGRIPNDCNLLDFGKMVIHGQLEELEKLDDFQEKEEQKVDAVVMIIPRGCKNLPKKLLNTIKQEAQRRDINVPVFGVMTKMDKVELDGDKKWRDLAREFQAELGIDGNFFVPLINYVYDDLLEDEPETNPNTDVPLLKMLNQIYKTKAKKIFLPWSKILEEKKEKELKEKLEKERKFGWCFYLLIGVIVLLVLAVLGFMVYTKLRRSSLNETFSTPKQDSTPRKKEL